MKVTTDGYLFAVTTIIIVTIMTQRFEGDLAALVAFLTITLGVLYLD